VPVGLVQVKGVEKIPFLNGFSGGKAILRFLVPPLAKLAAVMAPPPELLALDELELLELDELELLELDELELDELELLELEEGLPAELELELLELELLELAPVPPQPSRLSTGTATAAVLRIRTIFRREAA
jgi:hypothetical protein